MEKYVVFTNTPITLIIHGGGEPREGLAWRKFEWWFQPEQVSESGTTFYLFREGSETVKVNAKSVNKIIDRSCWKRKKDFPDR